MVGPLIQGDDLGEALDLGAVLGGRRDIGLRHHPWIDMAAVLAPQRALEILLGDQEVALLGLGDRYQLGVHAEIVGREWMSFRKSICPSLAAR